MPPSSSPMHVHDHARMQTLTHSSPQIITPTGRHGLLYSRKGNVRDLMLTKIFLNHASHVLYDKEKNFFAGEGNCEIGRNGVKTERKIMVICKQILGAQRTANVGCIS